MDLGFIIEYALYSAVPLLVVAIGAMYSERSGVVNIALEGLMILGAFFGFIFLNFMDSFSSVHLLNLFLAFIVGGLAAMAFSLIHAYAAINLKANQIISATAINLFAPALAIIFARMYNGSISKEINFERSNHIFSFLGIETNLGLFVGIAVLLIGNFVLYRTKFGLRLRACGEHPHAADSVGINVYKIRYAGVMISGFLAGIGGMILILSTLSAFSGTVSGYGFLALAVLIFGQWKPYRIAGAAMIFGVFRVIGSSYDSFDLLLRSGIKGEFYNMLPFVITIIVLIIYSKSSQAPRAAGEPYDPGKR